MGAAEGVDVSPTATLIAFKDFSAYEITGVFGATNFAVQKIKSDMGCVAPRTIQFVSGFGIIRLTHKGFALFDGVNDTLISEEERPRLFGRDDIPALDWTNIALAYATQSANPPLYICVCPSNGAAMTLVFVYDLIRRAWTVANLNTAVSTFQLIIDPNVLPVVLGGDYSAGKVRRYFAGDTDDDGTTIPWLLRTGQKQPGSPMERAYYLRLLTKFFGVTQGTTITAKFFYGPTAPISQQQCSRSSSYELRPARIWRCSSISSNSDSPMPRCSAQAARNFPESEPAAAAAPAADQGACVGWNCMRGVRP